MADYMAFLRGINLGGHTVTMPKLVAAFEDLGCEEVSTFIASGNVIFRSTSSAETLEQKIEAHLAELLGYEADTFIRTHREVSRLAEADPFPGSSLGGTLQVGFLRRALAAGARKKVAALSGERDELFVKARELYWLTAGGISETSINVRELDKILETTTRRNMNTIQRLATKYPAG